jgi:type VI secretion system secreted protein Hcp
MPYEIYAKVEQEGNLIKGECTKKEREDFIMVYGLEHKFTNPYDMHSGKSTGSIKHDPIVITKETDSSSPLLLKALAENADLDVELQFYQMKGKVETNYFTVKLSKARIMGIEPYVPIVFVPENAPYKHMEKVAFVYSSITWTIAEGGVEHEVNWEMGIK